MNTADNTPTPAGLTDPHNASEVIQWLTKVLPDLAGEVAARADHAKALVIAGCKINAHASVDVENRSVRIGLSARDPALPVMLRNIHIGTMIPLAAIVSMVQEAWPTHSIMRTARLGAMFEDFATQIVAHRTECHTSPEKVKFNVRRDIIERNLWRCSDDKAVRFLVDGVLSSENPALVLDEIWPVKADDDHSDKDPEATKN